MRSSRATLEEFGVEAKRADVGVVRQSPVQFDRALQALDLEFSEGARQALDGGGAAFVPDDQFAEQRIVERRHDVTRVQHAVEAHAWAARNT